jgi:hypothetical protein
MTPGSGRMRIEQLTERWSTAPPSARALGMLMQRFDLTDEEAFGYLRQCSQAQNRKLHDIAVEFAETREMPEVRRRPAAARRLPPSRKILILSDYARNRCSCLEG